MAVQTTSVPDTEGSLEQFAQNLVHQLTEHPTLYGIPDSMVQQLSGQLTDWETKKDAATAARDAARAATEAKDESRGTMDESLRTVVRLIQADPNVTDQARLAAGIRPHKTTRTPVPPPATAPVGSVIASEQLTHTLYFSDAATPTKRARPSGVAGCEVYVCIADEAPADPNKFRMVRFSTRTPETIRFDAADGGRTAHYLLRWMNGKGETGPWSQIVSATIPAV
ncbi:MAG: hypothetical protein KDA81_05480 [Planctomycetaceae bacterium]|nr:hypothetical protein [Planctomycetaceae bacterium]